MATRTLNMEPQLPWAEGSEDRLFNRLVIVFVIIFLIGGIVLNSLTLPEIERKKLTEVAPRLAKLIVENRVNGLGVAESVVQRQGDVFETYATLIQQPPR